MCGGVLYRINSRNGIVMASGSRSNASIAALSMAASGNLQPGVRAAWRKYRKRNVYQATRGVARFNVAAGVMA